MADCTLIFPFQLFDPHPAVAKGRPLVLIERDETVVAADVTDYKTDAIAKGDRTALETRVDYYRPQLAAYCRAVARFTGLAPDRIASRLVFLEPAEVVDLSDA